MAISNQIQRLTTLRNNIRTKLINLGILPAASTSATLSECYNVLSSVTGLGASSYTPTTVSQVIPSGRYLSGAQTINAIPSAYIIPSGTVVLSSSGTFDVGSYASADVTVTGGPSLEYMELESYYGFSVSNYTDRPLIKIVPVNGVVTEGLAAYVGRTYNVLNSTFTKVYGDYGLITKINDYAFYYCSAIVNSNISAANSNVITFDNCEYVGADAFFSCGVNGAITSLSASYKGNINTHTIVSFPKLTSCSAYAFACTPWGGLYCPNLEECGIGAFSGVGHYFISYGTFGPFDKLKTVNGLAFNRLSKEYAAAAISYMPALEIIKGNGNFQSCYTLTEFNAPVLSEISGDSTFASCSYLARFYAPELTNINGGSTFLYCSRLNVFDAPKLEHIGAPYTFSGCYNLEHIDLLNLSSMYGIGQFALCSKLQSLYIPKMTQFSNNFMFSACRSLSLVSFPKAELLSGTGLFSACFNLISIFLLGSSVCALGNTIAAMFRSTPISNYSTSAGRWGSVFVPASLLAEYKAATNWTTISSQIFAYEDYFS